jgi:tetratricopeptide (TPR) repeat protein
MYQQLRFADARDMAARVIAEIGQSDPGSLARLIVAKAMGALGASGPTAEGEADMERALELARQSGDPATQLHALRWWTSLRDEAGKGDRDDWLKLEETALKIGDWAAAFRAALNSALWLVDDNPSSVFEVSDRARQRALAHGRTEDSGWADYADAEAGFATGDWDRAVAAGTRAVDLGEANAYLRLTVRTWHVLIPIAAVRGDRKTLERAARWYRGLEGKFEFPDSPYSRIIRPAQDVELAAHGLIPPYVPEVEPRIAAFAEEPGGPSYSAALDRLLRAWLEAGEIEGASRAMAALSAAMPGFTRVSRTGLGIFELMRGRLAEAHGDRDESAAAARAALEHFRNGPLPWWMAKAIRLLERVDAADYELASEAFEIERSLKAIAPTA